MGSAVLKRVRSVGLVGAAVLVAVLSSGAAAGPTAASTTRPAIGSSSVIVQAPGAQAGAKAAVRALGGVVTRDLPIVRGFAATVPADQVAALRSTSGVLAVTPDDHVSMRSIDGGGRGGFQFYGHDLEDLPRPVYRHEVGADRLNADGVTGKGVTVALIDTGVAPVSDLASTVLNVADPVTGMPGDDCVNFSGEAGCNDSYGHGTFIAGLIAGSGAASYGFYGGVAPEAKIVSIKIAGRDGSADVSKVLAAIQWAVSFKDTYGIRVLNLSLGTDSTADYRHDPLNFAVERAWTSGVAVVVAAGNRGPATRTISKPADDPLVITVGAVDDRETSTVTDDTLPNFASRGPTAQGLAKPDIAAPGGHVVSLRSPGSRVEEVAPGGPLSGSPYRRGSGTSQSTGVVSGLAALAFQAHPDWSPDQLKGALVATAQASFSRDASGVGAGVVDGYRAVHSVPQPFATYARTPSDGAGTTFEPGGLESARGTEHVTGRPCAAAQRSLDKDCDAVKGAETAQGTYYDPYGYTGSAWTGSTWYSSQWASGLDGSTWYGSTWYGSTWYGSTWYGSTWYGGTEGSTWYGASLEGSTWYGVWD
ncbi:MAG: serine protease AprX [Frankiales bacterium]|nr:serine protease AprX [Frankiales bacterium]